MAKWSVALALAVVLGSILVAVDCDDDGKKKKGNSVKQAEVDEMVNNVLQWLQGVYKANNRKARQYSSGKPEKPRPFERATYLPPTGYPFPGAKPSPGYEENPASYNPDTSDNNAESEPPYQQSSEGGYKPSTPDYVPTNNYQPSTGGFKPQKPSYKPTTDAGYQQSTGGYKPGTQTSGGFHPGSHHTGSHKPPTTIQPTTGDYEPAFTNPENFGQQPSENQPDNGYDGTDGESDSRPIRPQRPQRPQRPVSSPSPSYTPPGTSRPSGDDDRHPPHIHALTVDCGKEMMTINIEFNKPYNGIIYSKGFYKQPECVYVQANSNQIKFSFTVSLNQCGTEFITAFDTEGQAYLENTLVLQNEEGIQEQWDHIHKVRCLWEGNLSQQLSSSLSVGMLRQETTNFSGDTAMAKLDIQLGRGPFAEPVDGLVKIGETLTLVISVTGDAEFDIQVKQCVAKDAEGRNVVPLTDENGCILKPKLFGAFQKTRDTGNTGASIIAYAFFNAFKFPDEMDLLIQCDVELCKTNCQECTLEQSLEPAKRRKRDVTLSGNDTLGLPVTIGKGIRIVLPEDKQELKMDSLCVSYMSFLLGAVFVLTVTATSSISAGIFWLKSQRQQMKY